MWIPVSQIETEGEVMSSPAFFQLFSRHINMKQDADLRIDVAAEEQRMVGKTQKGR